MDSEQQPQQPKQPHHRRIRRKSPARLLREIKRTNYAYAGPVMYSKLIHISSGYVSSNCFLGFFGRGKTFNVRVALADSNKGRRKGMPMTFSVFAVNILSNIIRNNLPFKPTTTEIEKAYQMYINTVLSEL